LFKTERGKMSTLSHVDNWTDSHRLLWIDFIRILLGVFLIAKGVVFVNNRGPVEWFFVQHHIEFLIIGAAVYVISVHLGGGIFIATGLVTRWAIGFQIPILIGALFLVNLPQRFGAINTETGISIIVLLLLVFFFFYGSGDFSLDYYLKKHPDQ
jgi:uncharacterized membrane protein YphA (DoxX/SURF4 family)